MARVAERSRDKTLLPRSMNLPDWPRRGEIWWAFTPGQPRDPHQPRPVLIVSVDARNRVADDFTVVPIFSQGRLGPTRVALPASEGGLAHDSIAFCEEITTIYQGFFDAGPLGGLVSEITMYRVTFAIQSAIVP